VVHVQITRRGICRTAAVPGCTAGRRRLATGLLLLLLGVLVVLVVVGQEVLGGEGGGPCSGQSRRRRGAHEAPADTRTVKGRGMDVSCSLVKWLGFRGQDGWKKFQNGNLKSNR
jgi:hypothetical protein